MLDPSSFDSSKTYPNPLQFENKNISVQLNTMAYHMISPSKIPSSTAYKERLRIFQGVIKQKNKNRINTIAVQTFVWEN